MPVSLILTPRTFSPVPGVVMTQQQASLPLVFGSSASVAAAALVPRTPGALTLTPNP